jgi:hypothetical protein
MDAPRRSRAKLRQRGTASVEAIIMLPFFIFMFASVYLMHAHYSGRQQAMLTARSCVWRFAANGCREDEKEDLQECLSPNGAEPAPVDVRKEDEPPPQQERDEEAQKQKEGGVTGGVADVLAVLEKIPILKSAVTWLFGRPVGATAKRIVQLPSYALPKQDRFVAYGSYHTLCNSIPKSFSQLGKDIFCSFVGSGTFDCE